MTACVCACYINDPTLIICVCICESILKCLPIQFILWSFLFIQTWRGESHRKWKNTEAKMKRSTSPPIMFITLPWLVPDVACLRRKEVHGQPLSGALRQTNKHTHTHTHTHVCTDTMYMYFILSPSSPPSSLTCSAARTSYKWVTWLPCVCSSPIARRPERLCGVGSCAYHKSKRVWEFVLHVGASHMLYE